MAKKKTKKNHILRRRVMRTMAAITMIMAVAVASIPVENFGTMQAAEDDIALLSLDSNFNMDEHYKDDEPKITGKYDKTYFADNKNGYNEGSYTGDEKTIQHIDDAGSITDAYNVLINSGKAIVSSKGSANNIKINETEYYDFVMFDITDASLKDALRVGEIAVKFDEDTAAEVAVTNPDQYYENEKGEKKQLPAINYKVKKFKDTYTGGNLTGLPDKIGSGAAGFPRGYDAKIGTPSISQKDIVDNCEKDAADNYFNSTLKPYNDDADKLLTIAETIKDGPETDADPDAVYPKLSSADVELWESFAKSDQNKKFKDIEAFKISEDDFSPGAGNRLKPVYEYIICQGYGLSADNNLKNFELVQQGGTSNIWLPRVKEGLSAASGQYTSNGYIATGKVSVVGIKSGALAGTAVESVEMPSSVAYIGESAFEGCQGLAGVTINADGCEIIGDKAFADSAAATVEFTNTTSAGKLKGIGVKAFVNTKNLAGIAIPASVTEIGAACFAGDSSLKTAAFRQGGNGKVTIGEYAFYNCAGLTEVKFEDANKQYDFKKGAFALERGKDSGSGFEFSFPIANTDIGIDSDYLLAGRANLKSVTFPAQIKGVIPANILRGCYNLEKAVFETASASYDTYNKAANAVIQTQLFSDVRNPKFIVEGPAADVAGEDAEPRKSSWTGILGYTVDDEYAPVPYKYKDSTGEHIELGYRGGQYVAKIDVKENNTAVLASYTVNNNVRPINERIPITIPNEIGNYRIVEIGENCFQKEVKDKIYQITIEDGYITKIGDGAFKGCKNLEWLYIGSPVTSIGTDAFAECGRLENVVFSQIGKSIEFLGDEDGYWIENLTIGENAFNTQSEHLTFYGAIHSGYAPFELAMGENSRKMTSTGAHIAYKSGAPKNLTVIRNEATGKATLVDYPHYDEIDIINKDYIDETYGQGYSIKEAFEESSYIVPGADNGFKEFDIVKGALDISLPKGIKSIDAAAFYDSKNTENTADAFYVNYRYTFKEGNISGGDKIYEPEKITSSAASTVRKDASLNSIELTDLYWKSAGTVYDEKYDQAYSDKNVAHGGLFSGYFDEQGLRISSRLYETYADTAGASAAPGLIGKTYAGHLYEQEYASGNDVVTNVSMSTVETLPDYAFDSCENLTTVKFGSDLSKMGVLPFRNAKGLYSVDLGANPKYAFANMVLYENKGDDANPDYEIMEMLEGRGKGGDYLSDSVLASDFLANVSGIAPAALSNNEYVRQIDLSATKITEIPKDCFKNDTNLNKITFPSTVRQIDTGALLNISNGAELIIPTGDCVITADAVDGKQNIFITGPAYMADGKTHTNLWHSYNTLAKSYNKNKDEKVFFNDYGNTYHIEFVDKDMKTISSFPIEVKDGESYNLEARDIPAAPAEDGRVFKYWMCKDANGSLQGVKAGDEAFVNIKGDRLYYPYYEPDPNSVVSEGDFKFEFDDKCDAMLGVTALKSGDSVSGGSMIVLKAKDDSKFAYWSVEGTNQEDAANYAGNFQSKVTQPMTTFLMPNADVKVTTNLKSGGTSTPGGDTPGGNTPGGSSAKKYKLTVVSGVISGNGSTGEYAAGTSVTISAFAPDSVTKIFSKWSSSNANVGFASATSSTTSLVMPESDITVTANYATRLGSDDEDDSGTSSRRPVSGTSATTPGTTTGAPAAPAAAGTTGTAADNTAGTADNSGNKIYITKNGISNKDVASISVDGSTDNFIVRISESPEATAAAEESLKNTYGSLDGIAYFPMDISLYDSTGQNKITDTYGLNITVTMPIPDVLVQYGGNARVAACDNGNLQQITPKFTTINGIACISFVPPHFSPYVIYVDTNNLIAGQMLDQTPKTGDPIHPKWFLAMGMACLSVVLFATSDGRRRRNIKAA